MIATAAGAAIPTNGKRSLLHVGAGAGEVPAVFSGYAETRLDIDPQWEPDIVADMTDLSVIADMSFDAIYTSHSLEHLYPEDMRLALKEFHRVLKEDGFVLVCVPDLEGVSPDEKVLFIAPAGEVRGRDLHFGYRPHIEKYGAGMIHRNGFVQESLRNALIEAGFSRVNVNRISGYNLMGAALK